MLLIPFSNSSNHTFRLVMRFATNPSGNQPFHEVLKCRQQTSSRLHSLSKQVSPYYLSAFLTHRRILVSPPELKKQRSANGTAECRSKVLLHTHAGVHCHWVSLTWKHRISVVFSAASSTVHYLCLHRPAFWKSPIQLWSAPFQVEFGCILPMLLQGIPSWAAPIPAVLPNWFAAMAVTGKGTLNHVLPRLQSIKLKERGLSISALLLISLQR